jgi:hypothetical protein
MKLKPVGTKLLVFPLETKNYVTDTNIELIQTELARAEVMEVSDELSNIYNVGDVVMLPESVGTLQIYNGKKCLWINGMGFPNGDVWAIVNEK